MKKRQTYFRHQRWHGWRQQTLALVAGGRAGHQVIFVLVRDVGSHRLTARIGALTTVWKDARPGGAMLTSLRRRLPSGEMKEELSMSVYAYRPAASSGRRLSPGRRTFDRKPMPQ